MRKAILALFETGAISSCTSPSTIRGCCSRTMPMSERGPSPGCSPRSTRSSHQIPRTGHRQDLGGGQALGRGAPASGQRPHSRSLGPACCPLRRCRLAQWGVQRGRPHDGVGVAQAEALGPPGRVSDTGGLCGPRRSAAGVQTGLRRPMGHQRRPVSRLKVLHSRAAQLRQFLTPGLGCQGDGTAGRS